MTTILTTWELGLAFGHVAHLAPLARGLARRGVTTAIAARDVITASGVPDRPFSAILQAPVYSRAVPRLPTLTYAQVIADGGMADADHATALVAAWLQLFDGVAPDGIATEHAPVSLLAAHVAGLRAVRTGYSWAAPPAVDPLPSLMPWLPDDAEARRAAGHVADAVVRTVCRRFGAPPLDGLVALLAGAPRLLGTWPEFDQFGTLAGETYYGPMSGLAASARPPWPSGPGPRVFVYLAGSHAGAVPLRDALARLGWPTIWHGSSPPPAPLPPNVAFSVLPVDTPFVLAGAQLLAGRGGHATACEALRHGCPQLVIPDTLETTLGGWRLQRQKLARMLPEAPSAAETEAALLALREPEVVAVTRAAADRYATYDAERAEDMMAHDALAALRL